MDTRWRRPAPLSSAAYPKGMGLWPLPSASHRDAQTDALLGRGFTKTRSIGSSLKFCLLAVGRPMSTRALARWNGIRAQVMRFCGRRAAVETLDGAPILMAKADYRNGPFIAFGAYSARRAEGSAPPVWKRFLANNQINAIFGVGAEMGSHRSSTCAISMVDSAGAEIPLHQNNRLLADAATAAAQLLTDKCQPLWHQHITRMGATALWHAEDGATAAL